MDTLPQSAQNDNPTRICNQCNREFPLTSDNFARGKHHKGGFRNQCKECVSKKNKAYREAHPEVSKAYEEVNREKRRAYQAEYRALHPEKIKERNAAYHIKNADAIKAQRAEAYRDNIEMHKERNRQNYAVHKEARRAYAARYRQEHPEQVQSYREANREKHREYDRLYHIAHREGKALSSIEYRKKNAERLKAKRKQYSQTSRGRIMARANAHNRRAMKRNAVGSHSTEELYQQLKRQKNKCYYCKKKLGNNRGDWHGDHIVPLAKGGSNDIHNIVIACPTCNIRKRDKFLHEWSEGGRLL